VDRGAENARAGGDIGQTRSQDVDPRATPVMKALPDTLRAGSPGELKERFEAARRGEPFLLYRDGDGGQRIVTLDGPAALSIGRQRASDVALDWDGSVSRVHAALERVGEQWTLVDDGSSRNGSFLNGDRVHGRRRVVDGDLITIGATTLAFVVPGERELTYSTLAVAASSAPVLTDAQRRVLLCLCRPLAADRYASTESNREIAAELVLGVDTVKSHLHTLFEAFGIGALPQNQKRAALARLALQRGVVRPDELMGGR
jgi:pSer/pThr/pTyr-binding forkhead associated (FHA) protein